MKISKNSKKLMSFIMMMAFVFSSLVVTQKPAKAAGGPIVEVIGATLRQDDGSGKQALRFAILIKNADQANDCGITIKANDITKEISVSGGQKNIYARDENANTITYTAVVTGIPAKYVARDFEFSGSVTSIGGQKTTTESVKKNLKDVAYAANYMINDAGQLEAFTQGENVAALAKCWDNAKRIASLDKQNYSGKFLKMSFKLRRAAGEDDVNAPNGIQVNDAPSYTQVVKRSVTITDSWQEFVGYYDARTLSEDLVLYVNASDTSNIYVKDFTCENVTPEYEVDLSGQQYDGDKKAIKITLSESTRAWETLYAKYGAYVQISFMFDKGNLLGYKDSPIDRGKDIFLKLFEERVTL